MSSIFQRDSGLMKLMTWVSDMMQVQMLWVLFSLLGMLVGGLFPATYAMFAVLRRLVRDRTQGNLNRLFWEEYRSNFSRSNRLGYTLVGISVLAFFCFRSSLQFAGQMAPLFMVLALAAGVLSVILFLYTGPVAAHFDLSVGQILKHALIVELSCPLHTAGIAAVLGLFLWSTRAYPVLVPFVSVAIAAYLIMWIAYDAFGQLKRAKEGTHKKEAKK